MTGRRFILVVVVGIVLTSSASAGLFSRRPKPSPQRAQELSAVLQSDPSESKRASAADELGQFDMKSYPEIVPLLLQALYDPAAEVRSQAVRSLGTLRPVSQEIGMALEQIAASDSSMKVRWQARTTLWHYYLAGYRTPKNNGPQLGPALNTQQEPPLAGAAHVPTKPTAASPHSASRFTPVPSASRLEPPKLQAPAPAISVPAPSVPHQPTLVPATPPTLVPLPAVPVDQGPVLDAPK